MRRRAAAAIVAALVLGTAPLTAAELSGRGTNLGRVSNGDIHGGLQVAVTGAIVEREVDFLIARAQDNRPLMRAADGTWHPWAGEQSEMIECGCRFGGSAATFDLGDRLPRDLSLPVTLTFGSRSNESTIFGYIVVDEP